MTAIEHHIETVAVEPRYGIRAVRVPGGGDAQTRLKGMLTPLGIKIELWDGVVEQLSEPVNGSMFQWKSVHVEGVFDSAKVGDWIVAHLGRLGHVSVQTMTDDEFHKIYKEAA